MRLYRKRAPSVVALVLACAVFTGAAVAGNGNGENAPGQEQRAEQSQQPATPPGQAKQQEAEQAPAPVTATAAATPTEQQATRPGKSSEARGHETTVAKADASAKQEARSSGPGVKPSNATSKWTTCSTGGGTGTSATCRGEHSSKADASKQYGHGGTAAQIANERGAPAGTIVTGPGNSQPHKVAVCPKKGNKSGGVDVHAVKSYSAAACAPTTSAPPTTAVTPPSQRTVTPTSQPAMTPTSPPAVTPTSQQTSGVAGEQLAGPRPGAGRPAPAGGVLGALAGVGRADVLPFTGIPLWIAALVAFALLLGGSAVRRATSF